MRPRILHLATRFPWPLDRGDRIRTYGLLEQYHRIADVTLVALHDRPATEAPLDPVARLCDRVEVVEHPPLAGLMNVVRGLPARDPFQVLYYRSAALEGLVDRLAREPWDLVVAQLFRLRPYLDRFTASRRVLDLTDCLTNTYERAAVTASGARRWFYREEARRVRRYEAESLDRVEEAWVVSDPDREALLALRPGAPVVVVPLGIQPAWNASAFRGPKEPLVLFLGNLTVGHNRDAARFLVRDVWPLVRRSRPDARLVLVGRRDTRAERLADRAAGIEVPGFVEDLGALFARATVGVAPLRFGAGLQNKVLESMAAGLPCVVTPIVRQPIGTGPETGLLEGRTPEELAGAIRALLDAPEEAARLGRASHEYALRTFRWDHAGDRIRSLLERTTRDSTPDPPTPPAPRTRGTA